MHNQIAVETNALAAKRKRERLAFGLTALLTTAVVAGVALHSSSSGNGVGQTTLSQTAAQASAFRSANFGIEEGASIKCSEDDPNLYRVTSDEKRQYPSTDIAAAWDADWDDYIIADCTGIPDGDPMSMPSDTDDTSDPTDPDATDETNADTSDPMEPEASEPESPGADEPEASEPESPDVSEPEADEPEADEPES
ncbi:hypothetical protein Gpo141_00005085, partial [Globisporangium polare]